MLPDPSAASWVPWLPASSCETMSVTEVTVLLPHACPPWRAPTLLLLLWSCPTALPGQSQALSISEAKSFSSVLLVNFAELNSLIVPTESMCVLVAAIRKVNYLVLNQHDQKTNPTFWHTKTFGNLRIRLSCFLWVWPDSSTNARRSQKAQCRKQPMKYCKVFITI